MTQALPTKNKVDNTGAPTKAEFRTALGDIWQYLNDLFGADGTAKTALSTVGALGHNVVKKSAAYTIVAGDRGKIILAEGTTWTLDLLAIATAGIGFPLIVVNRASGNITIDGNGTEKIKYAGATDAANGDATLVLAPGQSVMLVAMDEGAGTVYWSAPFISAGGAAVSITASVAANALTVTVKAGSVLTFRSATAATGTQGAVTLAADASLVVSSSSTLGVPANNTPFRLWLVVFDDAGTYRLGVINCLGGTAPSVSIYPLSAMSIASSTAEGGAGAADSARTFYTGTAVASKAYAIAGVLSFETGLAAIGTWAAGPTRIEGMRPGLALPGDTVQAVVSQTGAVATGSTSIPADDTIPQNTEGDQYMSQAITPVSAGNLLEIESQTILASPVTNGAIIAALFQDSTASALAVAAANANASASVPLSVPLAHHMLAGVTASTTLKIRAGTTTGGTNTFNGAASARQYGGALASFLKIKEICT